MTSAEDTPRSKAAAPDAPRESLTAPATVHPTPAEALVSLPAASLPPEIPPKTAAGSSMSPAMQQFIDRVLVPALVDEWLREHGRPEPAATDPSSDPTPASPADVK